MQRLRHMNLHLGINPIIVKELRSRMRDARAFTILTGVLLVLGVVSYLLYRMALATANYSYAPLSPQIGQTLFLALAFLELMMVSAIAPAVTAGAISGEQEKLTYEMLLATPMRPGSILWGKLFSALSYVFLLIFAAVPMSSLIFIFGGVALRDMAKALAVVIVVAVTFGILGLFMSAWLKRTSRATVASYLVVLALMFGTIFGYVAVGVIGQGEPPRWLLVPNPISALFSALEPSLPFEGSPLSFIGALGISWSSGVRALAGERISQTGIPRPLYHYSLPFFGALSLVLYLLSARLVLPNRRWRFGRKDVLLILALLILFGGAVALAFAASAGRYEGLNASAAGYPAPMIEPAMFEKVEVVEVAPGVGLETHTPTPAPAYPAYPAPAGTLPLAEADQAGLYATALRQLVVEDFFSGAPPEGGKLYLVMWTDDSAGDPDAPRADSSQIPEGVQYQLSASLGELEGLPADIAWIGNPDELEFDPDTGEIAGGGVIVTLGNLHSLEDGSILVSISLYLSNSQRMAKTYILENIDGIWQFR